MTTKEAIKRIQNHNEIHSKNEDFAVYITEALNMAIAALDKQIPKSVFTSYREAYCPSCRIKIDFGWFNKFKHCSRCGQALDWRDEK